MANIKVGKVTHYFDKIGVAVVKVAKPLKVGDNIKISGHGNEFTQTIDSMQTEHKEIKTAKKGLSIGMKVIQAVRENDEVYKVD